MNDQTQLVLDSQEGDTQATMKVLESYGYRAEGEWTSFLGKYIQLFKYGKINMKDKDTRRFLQLYIKDKVIRNKLKNHYQDYVGIVAAQETADYLQEKTQSLSEEDLKQSLLLLFMECMERFEVIKKEIGFSGFIYNVFRFKVYEHLRVTVFRKDVLQLKGVLEEDIDVYDRRADIKPNEAWFDRFYAGELSRDQLGIFWINGRCADVFSTLSVFERTLLRDRYLLKHTDGEIAKRYGYHINTIYTRRHRAIHTLDLKRKETLK